MFDHQTEFTRTPKYHIEGAADEWVGKKYRQTVAVQPLIELALGLRIPTILEKQHGREIRALAAEGKGFGIVAGTGTGKTLSIRPIAETILRTDVLKTGVVNREREATPETPTWNVIVVTTGIARRWFQDGDILATDTLVVDEIHQTSAELELCLALGKRVGCRFIWLSATVDPAFYARYLNAAEVLETSAFDPSKAADVKIVRKDPRTFLDDRFLQAVVKERRGVGMFLPTRAGVEEAAELVGERFPRINSAFYHGGEPDRVLSTFRVSTPSSSTTRASATSSSAARTSSPGSTSVRMRFCRWPGACTAASPAGECSYFPIATFISRL